MREIKIRSHHPFLPRQQRARARTRAFRTILRAALHSFDENFSAVISSKKEKSKADKISDQRNNFKTDELTFFKHLFKTSSSKKVSELRRAREIDYKREKWAIMVSFTLLFFIYLKIKNSFFKCMYQHLYQVHLSIFESSCKSLPYVQIYSFFTQIRNNTLLFALFSSQCSKKKAHLDPVASLFH